MGKEIKPKIRRRLQAQKKRQQLYDEGRYELSENEGFFCDDCDWRGLHAPMSDYNAYEVVNEDQPLCKCPECGGGAYTKESEVDHLKQFEEEYYVET